MKQFEFNEGGVCTNPNTIFRTTSKDTRYPYCGSYFSITTALADGGWVYGRDYNLSTCGGGYAASRDDKVKFPTEKEAVKAAAREIKEQIMGQVRWRGDEVPSPMEGKLIKMADDIIHPKPVEMSLF